jgi:hypothetical protein
MSDNEPQPKSSKSLLQSLREKKAQEKEDAIAISQTGQRIGHRITVEPKRATLAPFHEANARAMDLEIARRRNQVVTEGVTRKPIESLIQINFDKIKTGNTPHKKYTGLLEVLDEIENAGGSSRVQFNNTEYLKALEQALEFPSDISQKELALNPDTIKNFEDAVTILSSRGDFREWKAKLPDKIKDTFTTAIVNYDNSPFPNTKLSEVLTSIFNPIKEDK